MCVFSLSELYADSEYMWFVSSTVSGVGVGKSEMSVTEKEEEARLISCLYDIGYAKPQWYMELR